MLPSRALLLAASAALALTPALVRAQQGPLKAEVMKEGPSDSLPGAIKETLRVEGVRVLDGDGKPFARIWLRKAVPGSGKPSGPKGAVLFPVLGEGELLGAVEYVAEGHDYRDQSIAPGLYTIRYGLQPVNGDHLGVSPNRDFGLLVPAEGDTTADPLSAKTLEDRSAEAAGSNHPAVLMMLAAPEGPEDSPAIVRDEARDLWGIVLPLSLSVEGASAPVPLRVQVVLVGAAPI